MKRFLTLFTVSVMLLITAAACSQTKTPAVQDVANAVTAEVEIPSAVTKDAEDIPVYYGIDASKIEDGVLILCGSGAYPDELAIIKLKDSGDVEAAKTAAQTRLDSQIALYESYAADEMYKLNGARIYTKGNYVIYIATADNDKAEELVNAQF